MKRFAAACWASGLAAAWFAVVPAMLHAQDEADPAADAAADAAGDAAGDAMPGDAKPMSKPMSKPAADGDMADAGADADAPAKPAAGPAGKAPAPVNDPAVQSLLESNPKTAREIFRVIAYLVDLHRGDAAAPLAKKLLAAAPSPQECALIVREHGSSVVLHLGDAEGIGADGKKLADAIIAGARKYMHDPARLAGLIKSQLTHGAAEVRRNALQELKAADSDGVVALITVLADANSASLHAVVRDALAAFGASAVDPLVATTATRDDRLAGDAMSVLGQIRDASATVFLLGPALDKNAKRSAAARAAVQAIFGRQPSEAEAVTMLEKEITQRLAGSKRLRTNSAGRVELWNWNDAKRTLARRDFAHDEALAIGAARLASELAAARPSQTADQRLDVLASLQAAKLVGGVETPLAEKSAALQKAAARDVGVLNSALATALEKRYVPAAVGVIEALAVVANESILVGQGAQPAALVQAVRDPERVVRFAALDAVMKVSPTQPFAGSSSVVDALSFFAVSAGHRRCLVLEPRSVQAQSLAGMLRDSGYDADAGIIGRSGRVMLNASADYEFAFIDLGIGGPDVYDLVGELRRDPRTATLPIGLMAGENQLPRAKRIAQAFPRTMAFAQATDKKTIEYQADQLRTLEDRLTMSPQVRQRQAEMAMAWLAQLAAKHQAIYDLSRCEKQMIAGLDRANLARAATECLAHLGTHSSQRSLVEYASGSNRPIALRQAATTAFGKSVERFGVQLTSDEIVEQYNRYNASEHMNVATQKVLGTVLDLIEAPSRNARAKDHPTVKNAAATVAE